MAEPNGNPAKEAAQRPPAAADPAAKPSLISRLIKGLQNEEPTSGEGVKTRRRFVAFAVSGFLTTNFLMFLRFFFPRTIFEPKTVFSIGAPTDFGIGVDTKFQKSQRIWVVRNTERIFVISAICTHLDCTVQYREDLSHIWCACHNGHYDLNGANIAGPPPRPLEAYTVSVRGTEIVVRKNA